MGLPLVHGHVDLRHRCRVTLVDLVMGQASTLPLASATARRKAEALSWFVDMVDLSPVTTRAPRNGLEWLRDTVLVGETVRF